jgi:hypothetical protein
MKKPRSQPVKASRKTRSQPVAAVVDDVFAKDGRHRRVIGVLAGGGG